MKNVPRKIKRIGTVETNSSSSHSLVISSSQEDNLIRRGDPEFNLTINEDNVLVIPQTTINFGWDWNRYNDCLTKLYYAAALSYTFRSDDRIDYKNVTKFKSVLKRYLGVQDVIFEWDTEYLEEINKESTEDRLFGVSINVPSIDHQSFFESRLQIFESSDTVIRFIFSKNSWLFIGNDNSEGSNEYYKVAIINTKETDQDFIVRIPIGDPKIEFMDVATGARSGFSPLSSLLVERAVQGIINLSLNSLAATYLTWDNEQEKIITEVEPEKRFIKLNEASITKTNIRGQLSLDNDEILQDSHGKLYVLFYGLLSPDEMTTAIDKAIKEGMTNFADMILNNVNGINKAKTFKLVEVEIFSKEFDNRI